MERQDTSENAGRAAVRVMTWNIHGGVGSDRRCDLRRIARIVQRHKPDILALQEVDSRRRKAKPEGAFQFLARALGGYSAESKLIVAPDGDYGHVLISRWPLTDTVYHDISLSGREPRAAIETCAETPLGVLHVVAAHLGLSFRERRHQADLLAGIVKHGPEHAIMLGDFNDWIWRGSVQKVLGGLFPARSRHKTFPARRPLFALDRIYCRPSRMLARTWTDPAALHASDHLPVLADLHFAPDAGGAD